MKEIQNKTVSMKYIEAVNGVNIEELLHDLYVEQGKSIREIANQLNIHYHTVNSWLKLSGIVMRLPHEKLLELVEIKMKLKEK